MNKREFNRLLDDYLQGRLAAGARARVEQWLDELETVNDSNITWTETDKARLLNKINFQLDELEHKEKEVIRLKVWMTAAIMLLLLSIVSYCSWRIYSANGTKIANKVSRIEKMILSDGTIVWLKNESKLICPEKFTGPVRYVELHGEALFEIAENSSHPFMIKCGLLMAKVLGTSLNIRSTAHETEVIVLRGEVNITSRYDNHGVVAQANEKVVYNTEAQVLKTSLTGEKEKAIITAGTEYVMHFHNVTIKELLARIESKFNVKICRDSESIDHCRMTVDLTGQSLEHALQVIRERLQLEYAIKDGVVAFFGKGCD